MPGLSLRSLTTCTAALAALVVAPAALAAPPHDSRANARVISALPFTDILDTKTATTDAADPDVACDTQPTDTVWYRFAPATNTRIYATLEQSFYDVALYVFKQEIGGLTEIGCGDVVRAADLVGGATYYLMIGATHPVGGGPVELRVRAITDATNDDFDAAHTVPAMPFLEAIDTTPATAALDDPSGCGTGPSVWYRLTSAKVRRVDVLAYGTGTSWVAVYTGSRGALTRKICGGLFDVEFTAAAGTTYHVMISQMDPGVMPVWFLTEKFSKAIKLRADKRRVRYGNKARLTVDLSAAADADNRRVSIYLKPNEGRRVRIASGNVNSQGILRKTIRPSRSGDYEVEWAGDDRYEAKKGGPWQIDVRARMTIELRGSSSAPVVFTKVAPNQAGKFVVLDLQRQSGSRWEGVDIRPNRFRLGSRSSVAVRINGLPGGHQYRIRTICSCPNAMGESPYAYFRIG